jgi:hypothetical protein
MTRICPALLAGLETGTAVPVNTAVVVGKPRLCGFICLCLLRFFAAKKSVSIPNFSFPAWLSKAARLRTQTRKGNFTPCISRLKCPPEIGEPMKTLILPTFLFACIQCLQTRADTLTLASGRTISGTILQTNGDNLLLLSDYATFRFSRSNLKDIKLSQTNPANLEQIPATVIDKGMLRNVPYMSFRCGDDYEINIYGDPDHPAGIEAGVYHKLLTDAAAKANCLGFISDQLSSAGDKDLVQALNREKDMVVNNGLTFEITPPTDADAYNGWWVSIYDEARLNKARASDAELAQITTPRTAQPKLVLEDDTPSTWTASQLALARPSRPDTITFTNSSGRVYSNVQVVRVIDGVSLIWRDGASGGLAKLADLPPDLQRAYGYDPAKAAAADAADKERKARDQLAQQQAAQTTGQPYASPTSASDSSSPYYGSSSSSGLSSYSSASGRVYVHAYTKSDGTYVSAYTRSAPHPR